MGGDYSDIQLMVFHIEDGVHDPSYDC